MMDRYPLYSTPVLMIDEEEARQMANLGHDVYFFPFETLPIDQSRIPDFLGGRITQYHPPSLRATIATNLRFICSHPRKYGRFLRKATAYLGLRTSLSMVVMAAKLANIGVEYIRVHFASAIALRAMCIADLLGIPFSCTSHHGDIFINPDQHLLEIIKDAKPFVTVSEYNRKYLEKKYSLPAEAVRVVRFGIIPDHFKPPQKREENSPLVLLSVTWLREVKGIEYLVESCKVLCETHLKFRCFIIGGGDSRKIEKLIRSLGLTECVFLLGPVDHRAIKNFYIFADIFLLPSLSEGIPIALMEAMAMELPVVATAITGIPELVIDGVNGLLVEPGNPGALADKILLLSADKDLRERLGKMARKKVLESYDLAKNTKKLVELMCDGQENNTSSKTI